MQVQNQKAPVSSVQLQPKNHHLKAFIRKTVLIGALATTTLLSAQDFKQIPFSKDSTMGSHFLRDYIDRKKELNQTPSTLEFVGKFEGKINAYKNIKLTDEITLSVSDQKKILQEIFFYENDNYIFRYIPPQYSKVEHIMWFPGNLDVFKKIPPKSNASSKKE